MRGRDLPVCGNLVIPAGELRESASRSSGPGGQHVNKTSTRVTMRWNALASDALSPAQRSRLRHRLRARLTRGGEVVVHASRHRSRARNRELARERLAELVRDAIAVRRPRLPTRKTRAAHERRLAAKRHRGRLKQQRRPVEE